MKYNSRLEMYAFDRFSAEIQKIYGISREILFSPMLLLQFFCETGRISPRLFISRTIAAHSWHFCSIIFLSLSRSSVSAN